MVISGLNRRSERIIIGFGGGGTGGLYRSLEKKDIAPTEFRKFRKILTTLIPDKKPIKEFEFQGKKYRLEGQGHWETVGGKYQSGESLIAVVNKKRKPLLVVRKCEIVFEDSADDSEYSGSAQFHEAYLLAEEPLARTLYDRL